MPHYLDHIDLRVKSLAEVRDFYSRLLPALGFTRNVSFGPWLQFEVEALGDEAAAFFGVTEAPDHVPNANRIAFWATSREEVDRLGTVVRECGGRQLEGPDESEGPGYYALFFEDPSGNRLEICHRSATAR